MGYVPPGHERTFLRFKLHVGENTLPTELRTYTSALYVSDVMQRQNYNCHTVKRMWGLSYKTYWFIGLTTYEPVKHLNEMQRIEKK